MNTQNIEQMNYLYKWVSNWAVVYECNITAVGNNTIDANCLNACDTPIWVAGTLPHGSIYRMDIGGSGIYPSSLPLYIVP